jgi:hypothetical protein
MCHYPGVVWTSRLGHSYQLPTRPIIEPLPDPLPQREPAASPFVRPDGNWDESTIWDDAPPEANTTPSPRPPPEPDSDDDPPPF